MKHVERMNGTRERWSANQTAGALRKRGDWDVRDGPSAPVNRGKKGEEEEGGGGRAERI